MMSQLPRRVGGTRSLYSFAWTKLLSDRESFPDTFFREFDAPPVSTFPAVTTPRQIVEEWPSPVVWPPGGCRPIGDIVRDMHCIKRTFQPSLIRRKRKWGFLVRIRNRHGRNIINRRRHKKRSRLAM